MRARTSLLCMVLAAGVVQAQTVYKVFQPDGTVEFTDSPPPGRPAHALTLEPLNVFHPDGSLRQGVEPKLHQAKTVYEQLDIIKPGEGESIWGPVGQIDVSLSLSPPLRNGDKIDILLDGQAVAASGAGDVTLTDVNIGTHTVQAVVKNSAGKVVVQSAAVTFTKHQGEQHRLYN